MDDIDTTPSSRPPVNDQGQAGQGSPSPTETAIVSPNPVIQPLSPPSSTPAATTQPTVARTTTSHVASPHPTRAVAPAGQSIIISVRDSSSASKGLTLTDSPPARRRPSIASPKMLFSELYKSTKSPLSRFKLHPHTVLTDPDYDPDLISRDKAKQKDAVKRFLATKIRNDWEFQWPPKQEAPSREKPTNEVNEESALGTELTKDQTLEKEDVQGDNVIDDPSVEEMTEDSDADSTYSTISEDPDHYRPRTEWLSDWSEDDDGPMPPSAYRFDSPDAVGNTVKASELARSAKRRRSIRAEMEWNSGLACFNARRDAWTGAKTARVRPKPVSSVTTSPSTKRLSFWRLSSTSWPSSPIESAGAASPLSPGAIRISGDTTANPSSDADSGEVKAKSYSSSYPVETLIPIPPPLLPSANPMRASIIPGSYPSIFDKIVIQSMSPACPVNLADMVRALVVGWKRDGEWPPRPTEAPPVVAVRKKKKSAGTDNKKNNPARRMSFNFLGRKLSTTGDPDTAPHSPSQLERDDEANGTGKAIRRSLQRVLGLGHDRTSSTASNQSAVA